MFYSQNGPFEIVFLCLSHNLSWVIWLELTNVSWLKSLILVLVHSQWTYEACDCVFKNQFLPVCVLSLSASVFSEGRQVWGRDSETERQTRGGETGLTTLFCLIHLLITVPQMPICPSDYTHLHLCLYIQAESRADHSERLVSKLEKSIEVIEGTTSQ